MPTIKPRTAREQQIANQYKEQLDDCYTLFGAVAEKFRETAEAFDYLNNKGVENANIWRDNLNELAKELDNVRGSKEWEELVKRHQWRAENLYNSMEDKVILYAAKLIEEQRKQLDRAERALISAGFEDLGGQEWKPPVNKVVGELHKRVSELEEQNRKLSAGQWVRTADRLPDDMQDVLFHDGITRLGKYINQQWVMTGGLAVDSSYVESWFPLPEPPEAGGD